MNLDRLNFGSPAAERDINSGLLCYFIESDAFKRLAAREKTILLGNRGSGKSAIFKIIANTERKNGSIVIELTPEDYSYEMFTDTLAKEREGSWAKFGAYAAAWKYLIYVLVMKEINKAGRKFKSGPYLNIYNYLRDNHNGVAGNQIAVMISYLKRLECLKIGSNIEVGKAKELDKLYKLEEVAELIPDIKSICDSGRRVIILVDELDKGWDASEDAQAFVAGLFQSCITANEISKNLTVYVSLRKEIYDSIPSLYDDIQKYRDIIETIAWDEKSLLSLATKRIKYTIPELKEKDDADAWNAIFLETLQYRKTNSFNYICDRTLYRPREIIQFCNDCNETARTMSDGEPRFPIDYPVISQAELDYSKSRTMDLSSEYKFQYPGLLSLFETFRGLRYLFEKEQLWEHLFNVSEGSLGVDDHCSRWVKGIDPDVTIAILWQVGFIKAYIVGGLRTVQKRGSSYIGSYQLPTISLDNATKFHVHPMFRAYLSMKEK